MISKEQKVFGLGLSKTGTSSLGEALNFLGIKTIHYPYDGVTLNELKSGNYHLSLMRDWQGVVDIPVAPFYAGLDKAFPNSKFILTVREKEPWLHSCEQHWKLMDEWLHNFPDIKRFQEFIGPITYGAADFDSDLFSEAYDKHVTNIRKYFNGRLEDFLEIDICGGQGWSELCGFLGCDAPDIPFPRANEWMHLLIEAKQHVKEFIPSGANVLLLDQTGFGSDFAPENHVIPFLEKDGVYWGIPENDEQATRELLRMMGDGIEYVTVGFPCFWWLAFYPQFESILRQNFESLTENNAVKIFKLKR